ncbi:MAG TPA: MOSC domain-containing protein [Corynebacterium pollutisoli]|nr:MOSC domain-containing protein [Corynebacterium pollutisoli]
MNAIVVSTNLAVPRPDPGGAPRVSGIDKHPEPFIDVFTPGPSYGDGPGVVGDTVGDTQHHGGAQKAVYAFAREELDHWEERLGRGLPDGSFGENLTTQGVDLAGLLINQRVRIGDAELEVSIPRQPCRTFAGWLQEKGWVRTFSERGRCGAYFRVVVPGRISAGDEIVLLDAPAHDITMLTAFRGAQGDKGAAARIVEAECLPPMYHERMVTLVGTTPGADG